VQTAKTDHKFKNLLNRTCTCSRHDLRTSNHRIMANDFGKLERCEMGGSGSGRWDGHRKARTVESCCYLSIVGPSVKGTMPGGNWRIDHEKQGDTRFLVLRGNRDGWTAEVWIELLFWNPRFGGRSFWLLCPRCGRKCRKLYAPPGVADYRCRLCWRLSYESSQEAHRWDRGTAAAMLAPMYAAQGISMRQVEKAMRADFKAQREANRHR